MSASKVLPLESERVPLFPYEMGMKMELPTTDNTLGSDACLVDHSSEHHVPMTAVKAAEAAITTLPPCTKTPPGSKAVKSACVDSLFPNSSAKVVDTHSTSSKPSLEAVSTPMPIPLKHGATSQQKTKQRNRRGKRDYAAANWYKPTTSDAPPKARVDLSAVTRGLASVKAANIAAAERRSLREAERAANPGAPELGPVFNVVFLQTVDGEVTGRPKRLQYDGNNSKSPSPVSDTPDTCTQDGHAQQIKTLPSSSSTSATPAPTLRLAKCQPYASATNKLTAPFKSPLKRPAPTQTPPMSSSPLQPAKPGQGSTLIPKPAPSTPGAASTPMTPTAQAQLPESDVSLALTARALRKDIDNLAQASTILNHEATKPATPSPHPAHPATSAKEPEEHKGTTSLDARTRVWLLAARIAAEELLPLMRAKFAEQGGYAAVQRNWAKMRTDSTTNANGSSSGLLDDGHDKAQDETDDCFTMAMMLGLVGVSAKAVGWCEVGADGEGMWVG